MSAQHQELEPPAAGDVSLISPASVDALLEIPEGTCVLTHDVLVVDSIVKSVGDDRAGATAVFIGTTRNSFQGKTVIRLEYQAYSKLAMKTMTDIIRKAHAMQTRSVHHPDQREVPSLIRSAVYHRLGIVPVGEPSIVIAVSSPHRKEAFTACEYILEQVKKRAQIWKREVYAGEQEAEAEWKANAST